MDRDKSDSATLQCTCDLLLLLFIICFFSFFFFFQAEDGIRDYKVTGVQTCALPISEIPKTFKHPRAGDESCESQSPPIIGGGGHGTALSHRRITYSLARRGRRLRMG